LIDQKFLPYKFKATFYLKTGKLIVLSSSLNIDIKDCGNKIDKNVLRVITVNLSVVDETARYLCWLAREILEDSQLYFFALCQPTKRFFSGTGQPM